MLRDTANISGAKCSQEHARVAGLQKPANALKNHERMAECIICLKMFGKVSDLCRHIRRVQEEATETPSASVKSNTLSIAYENKHKVDTRAPSPISSETLLNRIKDKTFSGASCDCKWWDCNRVHQYLLEKKRNTNQKFVTKSTSRSGLYYTSYFHIG